MSGTGPNDAISRFHDELHELKTELQVLMDDAQSTFEGARDCCDRVKDLMDDLAKPQEKETDQ